MPDKPTLPRLFEGLHRTMEAELGLAKDAIDHPGTKGTLSEDKWTEVLQRHLPCRYAVNRAFVIDSSDTVSQQIDIVVHDRQYSPFVLNSGSALYVPAESVYAVLEVKQTLNAEHVNYAAEKIASVRGLHRTSLPIKHAGGEHPAKTPQHIWGGLVTLDSDWNPPLGNPLRGVLSELRGNGHIDLGCAVRHGVFDVKYKPHEAPTIVTEPSRASLALFLLRFIALLQSSATVPCIDVLAYARKLTKEPSKSKACM